MSIEFRPENQQPRISFQREYKVDNDKFQKFIEPYTKDIDQENTKLQNEVEELSQKNDPIETGLFAFSGITIIALALINPMAPILMLGLLGSGGYLVFKSGKGLHALAVTVSKISQKIAENEELKRTLNSEDFKSLNAFESRRDFYKLLSKRIKRDQLTGNDLKALTYLHKLVKKDPTSTPETDKLFENLQQEWTTNRRIVDWTDVSKRKT